MIIGVDSLRGHEPSRAISGSIHPINERNEERKEKKRRKKKINKEKRNEEKRKELGG